MNRKNQLLKEVALLEELLLELQKAKEAAIGKGNLIQLKILDEALEKTAELIEVTREGIALCSNEDYLSEIPSNYVCHECGKNNCKLWRPYNSFHIELKCATCAGIDQKIDVSSMTPDGCIPSGTLLGRTDQIGWLVPAIPTIEGGSYWGYTSVPQEGCDWWKGLPI